MLLQVPRSNLLHLRTLVFTFSYVVNFLQYYCYLIAKFYAQKLLKCSTYLIIFTKILLKRNGNCQLMQLLFYTDFFRQCGQNIARKRIKIVRKVTEKVMSRFVTKKYRKKSRRKLNEEQWWISFERYKDFILHPLSFFYT